MTSYLYRLICVWVWLWIFTGAIAVAALLMGWIIGKHVTLMIFPILAIASAIMAIMITRPTVEDDA